MKTINEALDESYKISGENAYFVSVFMSGIEFAQQWIGFEKEFPPVELEIIVKDESNKKHKRVFTPLDKADVKYLAENFTHWRPVERQ
jgi:hypothetical protein